ncbi:MAG: SpoIIE family protein phosphatase [Bacteroidota bacterium]
MSPTIADRLRYNVLFETLDEEEYGLILPYMQEHVYRTGEVIIRHESEGEDLYLIVRGRVKILKPLADGGERLLALLHEGDFFGELELIDGRPRSATAVAAEDCILFTLQRGFFLQLLGESRAFADRLLIVLSLRLRSVNNLFIQELVATRQEMDAEVRRLEDLLEAARNVNSTLDLDRVLATVVDVAMRIVDCGAGTLYLVDETRGELWSKVLRESRLEEVRLPLGRGIAGHVAVTGESLNIPDAYADPRFDPDFDRRSGFRTGSVLCMPVRNRTGTVIGVLQLLNKRSVLFTRSDEQFVAALSVHAAVAVENARLYERDKALARMEQEVRLAARIQTDLLPRSSPHVPGYEICGRSMPAQSVGGDYFDFMTPGDGDLVLCLGDVSGKGLPASLLMAGLQATLRALTRPGETPGAAVRGANALLFESTSPEKFVTLVYARLDPVRHRLAYTNCGQEPPLVCTEGGLLHLREGGPPLAVVSQFDFQEGVTPLAPGDQVVFYTDGVSEASSPSGELYGADRLETLLRSSRGLSSAALLDRILKDVERHQGGALQQDDITLVVIRRTGEPADDPVRKDI